MYISTVNEVSSCWSSAGPVGARIILFFALANQKDIIIVDSSARLAQIAKDANNRVLVLQMLIFFCWSTWDINQCARAEINELKLDH